MSILHSRTNSTGQTAFGPFDSSHYAALAFVTACIVPCWPPQSSFRRGLLFLQGLFATVFVFFAPPPSHISNTAVIYTAGVLNGNLLARYVDRLYLHTPEKEFFRLDDRPLLNGPPLMPKRGPSGKQPARECSGSLTVPEKILWTFELLTTTRGIGWNWRVAGIPQQPTHISRSQFLRRCAIAWATMYTSLHLLNISCRAILTSFSSIHDPWTRATLMSLTSNPLFIYAFIVLGWAVTIYSHFALLMLPLSMVCVGLRIGPEAWQEFGAWPPNFGSFKDAYSIRRFWGYTWHQQMRRTTSAPGIHLVSLLPLSLQKSQGKIPRLLRRYFQLFAVFLVSGLIHAAGSYNVTRTFRLPLSDGGEIKYFLLQAFAIMVEDFVLWASGIDCRDGRLNGVGRYMGYTLTAWFYIFTRVRYKAVPLAAAHGIEDERGELFAAVELVRRGVVAVPGNIVALILDKAAA